MTAWKALVWLYLRPVQEMAVLCIIGCKPFKQVANCLWHGEAGSAYGVCRFLAVDGVVLFSGALRQPVDLGLARFKLSAGHGLMGR